MRFEIEYLADYEYSEPVRDNLNALRVRPASTLLQISRLANPAYLIEVEAIAILPPRA